MIKKHEYPEVDWFETICDNCECNLEDIEENTLFPTYTDAQNLANEEGWETLENDTHYCEICRIEKTFESVDTNLDWNTWRFKDALNYLRPRGAEIRWYQNGVRVLS